MKEKRNSSILGRVFTATAAIVVLTLAPTGVAQAAEVTLTATQYQDVVVHHQVARTNAYIDNRMSMYMTSAGHGGGYVTLGVRNTVGTQIARAVGSYNTWKAFTTSTGSTAIPGGTFYMNSKVTAMCGGSGCGLLTWSSGLRYSIKW